MNTPRVPFPGAPGKTRAWPAPAPGHRPQRDLTVDRCRCCLAPQVEPRPGYCDRPKGAPVTQSPAAVARIFHESWTNRDPEAGMAVIADDCEF